MKPGRGRPVKLDKENEEYVQTVKTLIANEPKNTRQVVEQVAEKFDIKLSKKTLKRFLKNLNTNGNAFENA